MASGANPTTRNVHVRPNVLVADIQSCEKVGEKDKEGMQRFDIVATFDDKGEKIARFNVYAKSLKVALEIIEGFGRQTKGLDLTAFEAFKTKHISKATTFRIALSHNDEEHADSLHFRRANRAFTQYKDVFGPKAQMGTPEIKLDTQALKEIDALERKLGAKFKKKKKKPVQLQVTRIPNAASAASAASAAAVPLPQP